MSNSTTGIVNGLTKTKVLASSLKTMAALMYSYISVQSLQTVSKLLLKAKKLSSL